MIISLDYGRGGLEVEVPDTSNVLNMKEVAGLDRIDSRLNEALLDPIGVPPLHQLVCGKQSVCIVISDITRPVPNSVILPPILKTLEEAGIARQDISILVGTGLHRPNLGEELESLVGENIARNYRIVNHMAREKGTLVFVGETSCGAPIWIDKLYMDADLKIATSLIEPHLMAGFSGGRKAICPGLMGVDTMRVLHGPQILADRSACEGSIEGNPFHQQALEVAKHVGVDFTLNVAMNERREITGIFSGDLEKAHAAGVEFVEEQNGAWIDRPADIVITSSAGLPLDLTFYQAVKGLTAVLPIVSEGGTIIIVSACEEGIGSPEFESLLVKMDSPEHFAEHLADPNFFVIDQWQLQELCKVLEKANVSMYSEGIAPDKHGDLFVKMVDSVESGLADALAIHGEDARIAVVPKGPYVLTKLREPR